MHDTDLLARIPALDSLAGQPPLEEMLHSFDQEYEVAFKEEIYLVRDNGAVFRRARPQGRRRKLDEAWMFGSLERHKGYLVVGEHVVHQIVASAFHGPRPSNGHVVDHIDTNRQNNRPNNLRWVTRLENILLNPITRAKIVLAFGSLEAFFENPGAHSVPNLEWMRTVTTEEAEASRERMLEWAEKGQAGGSGSLGAWIYKPKPRSAGDAKTSAKGPRLELQAPVGLRTLDTPSLTPGAFQRNWRTPTEFPECPDVGADDALSLYLDRLKAGAVFARNQYGHSIVAEAGAGADNILSVVCSTQTGVKGWSRAKVYVEGGAFCHEAGGTFFTREGAMKAHCLTIGTPSEEYEGSIDDFC